MLLKPRPWRGFFPAKRALAKSRRRAFKITGLCRTGQTPSPAIFMSSSTPSTPISYKDAGVDIDAGDALVERIKPLAKKTMREGVMAGIGGFGALFEVPKRYQEPVLVSGTDGVGTKLKLAFEWNMHDTVGIDLVAMSVNDVLVQGAEPLFFLDYFACGKLDVDTAAAVVGGIARGLRAVRLRADRRRDRRNARHVPGRRIRPGRFCRGRGGKIQDPHRPERAAGDVVLGLASSGVHSNGFSLVRKCIERARRQWHGPGAARWQALQGRHHGAHAPVREERPGRAGATPDQGPVPHHRRRPAGEHSARAARRPGGPPEGRQLAPDRAVCLAAEDRRHR